MVYELLPIGARKRPPFDTIIDVRSPAEFAEDHIPGAINLPALDDPQRAQIGIIYVKQSRFLARASVPHLTPLSTFVRRLSLPKTISPVRSTCPP